MLTSVSTHVPNLTTSQPSNPAHDRFSEVLGDFFYYLIYSN